MKIEICFEQVSYPLGKHGSTLLHVNDRFISSVQQKISKMLLAYLTFFNTQKVFLVKVKPFCS